MISSQQRLALLLVGLVLGVSCQPRPGVDHFLGPAEVANSELDRVTGDEPDEIEESRALRTSREHYHELKYSKGILIKQLLNFLFSAFMNGIIAVMFNWFFPFKVIPPIPGRLGLGQLFGGFLPKHTPYHGYLPAPPPPPPYHGFG